MHYRITKCTRNGYQFYPKYYYQEINNQQLQSRHLTKSHKQNMQQIAVILVLILYSSISSVLGKLTLFFVIFSFSFLFDLTSFIHAVRRWYNNIFLCVVNIKIYSKNKNIMTIPLQHDGISIFIQH